MPVSNDRISKYKEETNPTYTDLYPGLHKKETRFPQSIVRGTYTKRHYNCIYC